MLEHVYCRLAYVVRRSDMVMVLGNTKGRGRPKLTLEVVVQKTLGFLNILEYDDFDIG